MNDLFRVHLPHQDIKFICHDKNVLKNYPIIPAKNCLPEWYSKLKASEPNISKCMPVRDMISAGYIIPNAFEMGLGTNMENDVANVEVVHPVERPGEFYTFLNHMINPDSFHTHEQCPVHINNEKKTYFKIKLPWRIETPKGYSTLFIQPFYNFNTDLVVLPAIIDTDEYDHSNLNFPCYVTKQEADLKPGQPLVQCIPFKREVWKHTLELGKEETNSKMNLFLNNMYKRAFHQKKSFN
tara:strand:+ start:276 stop:992 length:717 start_codon:yes stop_codon:yes gene_type:complete